MSYQVLARKWRPGRFEDLVGQEHVVQALSNALERDRLHHAYLFTGTRGVGKTTIARILAKSLNCDEGVSKTPCGRCASCREIAEGRYADLLEVDAASRTKVDQTRELLDNVPFAPVRGRFKIYLIDEVHMFSASSFNALLKTLEEPPDHVKFLLATTDPQKVPMTVLSRCLQFSLKRLLPGQIIEQFRRVLGVEDIEFDDKSLKLLAHGADGSMRDGLSLLDQAIAFGGGRIAEADVRAMLGVVSRDITLDLLDALAAADGARLLGEVARVAESSPDFAGLLRDLLATLHRVAMYQQVPETLDPDDPERERLEALAASLAPEDAQLYYQVLLLGQADLPLAPDPRTGLEMVLLRALAFRPDVSDGSEPPRPASSARPRTAPARAAPASASAPRAAPAVERSSGKPSAEVSTPTPPVPTSPASPVGAVQLTDSEDWHRLVQGLSLRGIASQLLAHCAFASYDGTNLSLRLDPSGKTMRVGSAEERLTDALRAHLGEQLKLQILVGSAEPETPAQRQARIGAERKRAAEATMSADPVAQALKEQLGAEWVPGSIKPTEPVGTSE